MVANGLTEDNVQHDGEPTSLELGQHNRAVANYDQLLFRPAQENFNVNCEPFPLILQSLRLELNELFLPASSNHLIHLKVSLDTICTILPTNASFFDSKFSNLSGF